jgi:hypothetical protein
MSTVEWPSQAAVRASSLHVAGAGLRGAGCMARKESAAICFRILHGNLIRFQKEAHFEI